MKTKYTGIELLETIVNKGINIKQKVNVLDKYGAVFISNLPIEDIDIKTITKYYFELIEEDEIDIQDIEEIPNMKIEGNDVEILVKYYKKFKELTQAVKQLDKQIKELKESENKQ